MFPAISPSLLPSSSASCDERNIGVGSLNAKRKIDSSELQSTLLAKRAKVAGREVKIYSCDEAASGCLVEKGYKYEQIERSELIHKIGEGAFANVYLLNRSIKGGASLPVAIKIPRLAMDKDKLSTSEEFAGKLNKLFKKEGAILKESEHLGVVKFLGFFSYQGWVCLGLQYHKLTLQEALHVYQSPKTANYTSKLDFPDIKKIIGMVNLLFSCVQFLHNKDIVHADIASKNLLVTPKTDNKLDFEQLIIADFGTANYPTGFINPCFNSPPEYSPPDSLKPNKAGDRFSLGYVLYNLVLKRNIVQAWDYASSTPQLDSVDLNESPTPTVSEDSDIKSVSGSDGSDMANTSSSEHYSHSGSVFEDGVDCAALIPTVFEAESDQEEILQPEARGGASALYEEEEIVSSMHHALQPETDSDIQVPLVVEEVDADKELNGNKELILRFETPEGLLEANDNDDEKDLKVQLLKAICEPMMTKDPGQRLSIEEALIRLNGLILADSPSS